MDEGIKGMKQGGTRRLLIPPSLAYVEGLEDGKPGPMPAGFGPRQQMRRVQMLSWRVCVSRSAGNTSSLIVGTIRGNNLGTTSSQYILEDSPKM